MEVNLEASSPAAGRGAELAREVLTAVVAAGRGERSVLNDTLNRVQREIEGNRELGMHLLLSQASLTRLALHLAADVAADASDVEAAKAIDATLQALLATAARVDLRY